MNLSNAARCEAQHTADPPIRHEFHILSNVPGLAHGVFTRRGGVSRPPYATLNVAWNNGDSRDAVRENLHRVMDALGIERLISSYQTHEDTIRIIDEEELSKAESRPPALIAAPCDALVTTLRGVGLMIKIADCQSIFLVDPASGAIANIHSGWRGSVRNIAGKTVRTLVERFGSRPEDILATISPSLGPCCAEFINYRDELPPSFLSFQTRPLYFDFWEITRAQLREAGVRPENIETAGRCTVCERSDFFSYRGERDTGRNASVIAWKGPVED